MLPQVPFCTLGPRRQHSVWVAAMQYAEMPAVRPKRSLVTTFFVAVLGLFCVVTCGDLLSCNEESERSKIRKT